MAPDEWWLLGIQLAMGFSLAAVAGLRAFLPLFVTSILARSGYLELSTSFEWMGSTPALVVFGAAVVFELAGDKIPAVDHLLDAAGILVKPTAATVMAASMITEMDPLLATVLGLATGGAVAGTVHVVKAKTRLIASALTVGVANPVISLLEDVASLVGTVLAVLLPLLAAIIAAAMLIGLVVWVLRRRVKSVRHAAGATRLEHGSLTSGPGSGTLPP